jgi:hypothetical protein
MSYFHSESRNARLDLTIRIKFLNLAGMPASVEGIAAEDSVDERLGALIAQGGKNVIRKTGANTELAGSMSALNPGEICMQTSQRLTPGGFEEHIEACSVCASRVELQLDFMECLEAAIYQRRAEPETEKVRGALMVSAPELNFAVCGEIDFGAYGAGSLSS